MTSLERYQIIIGVVQILSTILISAILYVQAQKLKKSEMYGNVINAYNLLNSVAVADIDNLRILDGLGRQNIVEPDEIRRKRWCSFLWLVALQQTYLAYKEKLIDREYADQALYQQLSVILKDDLVYWLLRNRGFYPGFVSYCTDIRLGLFPDKPLDYTEEEAVAGI